MELETIASISKIIPSRIKRESKSVWDKMVHASFRKVVLFDLLFFGLGIALGAGLSAAFLMEDVYQLIPRW